MHKTNEAFKDLPQYLAQYAPHVDKQRREDWLTEAIQISAYNADMVKSFESPDKRSAHIANLVQKDIRRLGSFGGNDIAALWMDDQGIFSPFATEEGLPQNTQSVIEAKLCIVAPTRMTGDMIRGVALEPMAQLDFDKKVQKLGWKPRPDLLEIFTSLYDKRLPEHPWLTGMPDGIYEDNEGKIHVVDFKVPAGPDTIKIMQRDPPEGYNAQMGTYEAILNYHGIQVESRILAPLSLKTMEVTLIPMPGVKDFTQKLLDLGDKAWAHVLSGVVPARKYSPQDVENLQVVHPRVEHFANAYTFYNAIKNLADKKASEEKNNLEWSLKKYHDIAPGDHKKVKLPVGISYSTTQPKPEPNKDAMLRKIQELGGNIDDPDLYIEKNPSTRATVSRSKKSPYAPRLEQIRSLSDEMIGELDEELIAMIGPEPCPSPEDGIELADEEQAENEQKAGSNEAPQKENSFNEQESGMSP